MGSNVDSSELRLVDQALQDDREARRELFEMYRDVAYRVAFRITGRNEDALDVVQDGFIRAFERLESFQRDASFKTWLLRIVSNRALDHLRSRKVRLATSLDGDEDNSPADYLAGSDDAAPGDDLDRAELAERLQGAVESLPPDQRSTFALYASGDVTYGEIAEIVNVPIGTVMSRIYHARRRLREALADLAPPQIERSET